MRKKKITQKNMAKELYICHTYYHLLISIVKNIRKKGQNDLAIECRDNKVARNNRKILKKLKEKNIFKEIHILDYSNPKGESRYSEIRYIVKGLKTIFFRVRKFIKKQKIDFKEYDEIFIFNDEMIYGKILNLLKIRYNIIEDGLNSLKNNTALISKKHSGIKKILKTKVFKIPLLAESKYIKTIEVNDKNGVYLDKDKLIEIPRKELFHSLNSDEKKEICDIFMTEFNVKKYNGYSILIPQPFCDDRILKNELEQINLYRKIIEEHMPEEKIIIKAHPRDNVNYEKYFPDATIINEPFPIEILNFFEDIKFKKVVTVTSTSLNFLETVEEKVYLGWEWLEKYKKGLK